ncbi:MAG: RluA family pseudouridine synthase [Fusobacterium sp. JB019]|nr:RluA family pseudouridine synthase [Fusobacterium sp. JB020]MDP0506956.1 RluA family pseudouridine synthase [Fusobacterium sp. JB019]
MKTIIFSVDNFSEKKRIDTIIQKNIPGKSRNYIQFLIENNYVQVDSKTINKCSLKLKKNQKIQVNLPEEKIQKIKEEKILLDIVYEDKFIAVINKPPNMTVHPAQNNYSGTLVNALLYNFSSLSNLEDDPIRPGIVHRLDKNTSGLIIIAKTDLAHEKLVTMFKEKKIAKTYLAICKGTFKEKKFRLENLIGRDPKDRKRMAVVKKNGKLAISNFKVIDETTNFSLLKVNIETGRTHQIRVHLKYLNHPILGDDTYGTSSKLTSRQMLHAYVLRFYHPITNENITLKGNLPADFLKTLKNLKLEINDKNILGDNYE